MKLSAGQRIKSAPWPAQNRPIARRKKPMKVRALFINFSDPGGLFRDVRYVPKADIRHGRLERPKFSLIVFDDDTTRAIPGQSHRIVHCGAKNSRPGNQRDLFGTHALLARASRRNSTLRALMAR